MRDSSINGARIIIHEQIFSLFLPPYIKIIPDGLKTQM